MTACQKNRSGKRTATGLAFALTLLLAGAAAGQGKQLFFVGTNSYLGSISRDGAVSDAVYLRWDTVESELPSDLMTFRLTRGALTIATLAAQEVMSPSEIAGLYVGSGQDRRKQETIRWLNEEDPQMTVDGTNFHTLIHDRIDPLSVDFNNFFAILASRNDFNIARARYRAFLDVGLAPGAYTYSLYGSDGSSEVLLGEIVVSVAAGVHEPLPTPENFVQVDLARCDAPEEARDHASVALHWWHPGKVGMLPEPNTQYAAAVMTTGYDLYRTTSTIMGAPPLRDIRLEAAGILHLPDGTVPIPGLSKVNDQPIVILGTPEREGRHKGFNAKYHNIRDVAESLAAAGFEPGDTLGYYLVARDLTGNYGTTARLAATIRDTRRPPAPWNLATVQRDYDDEFHLTWDHVDVRNYYADFQLHRTYCNLETARFDKELDFVGARQDCEVDLPREVPLDINEYLIYRFESIGKARDFVDSDGDGVSDSDEQIAIGGLSFPQYSDPGTACDAGMVPGGAINYLVDVISASASPYAIMRDSGRLIIDYRDTAGPILQKAKVFWYRVASRTPSGKVSHLSAPRRARARDRDVPELSDLPGVALETLECDYFASLAASGDPHFAIDATNYKVATSARAECTEPAFGGTVRFDVPIEDDPGGGARGAELDPGGCTSLTNLCAGAADAAVSFFDANGDVLNSIAHAGGFGSVCPITQVATLNPDCIARPIVPGEALPGPPDLVLPVLVDVCLNLYHDIGGESFKFATICPGDPPPNFKFPTLDGEICLSYSLSDDNNSVSAKYNFPCFTLFLPIPDAPQAVEFAFTDGTTDAQLLFVPPERPVTGTILEWYQKGETGRERVFEAHADHRGSDGLLQVDVTLNTPPPLPGVQEEWCFRGRSIARSGTLSPWSTQACGFRLPIGETVTEYLPWPKIPKPAKGAIDLEADYLSDDGRAVVLLSNPIIIGSCGITPGQCDGQVGGGQCLSPPDVRHLSDCPEICNTLNIQLKEPLGFVAYRQSKASPTGTPSEFAQVSPVIDLLRCESDSSAPFIKAIEDPFIKLLEFQAPQPWPGIRLVFLDRTPHIESEWYRYQFVYLDALGEITGYRNTNWIEAN
jgi:hypothetical protein